MQKLKIVARRRLKTGKGYANKIRRQGLVPAIIYKKGVSIPLELKETDLIHLLHQAHSENVLLEVEIQDGSNKEVKTAILKEVTHDPIKGRILHVDFQEISLEEVVRVKVPVEVKGEPIGVKRDGGILEHFLWEIEVECKASQIPEKIEIDVSDLEIDDAIHLSDLKLPDGVKAIGPADQVVLHVAAPKVEEVVEEVTEEAGEPEVIKEKKEEEEGKGRE